MNVNLVSYNQKTKDIDNTPDCDKYVISSDFVNEEWSLDLIPEKSMKLILEITRTQISRFNRKRERLKQIVHEFEAVI